MNKDIFKARGGNVFTEGVETFLPIRIERLSIWEVQSFNFRRMEVREVCAELDPWTISVHSVQGPIWITFIIQIKNSQ